MGHWIALIDASFTPFLYKSTAYIMYHTSCGTVLRRNCEVVWASSLCWWLGGAVPSATLLLFLMHAPVAMRPTSDSGPSGPCKTCTHIPSGGASAFRQEVTARGGIFCIFLFSLPTAVHSLYRIVACLLAQPHNVVNGDNAICIDAQFLELPYG